MNYDYGSLSHKGFPEPYFCNDPDGWDVHRNWLYWPLIVTDKIWYHEKSEENEVSVYVYQLHIPEDTPLYWGLHCKPENQTADPIHASITDEYGNSGTFSIIFENNEDGSISTGAKVSVNHDHERENDEFKMETV
ncbi:hypothetical protein [Enterovibrio nigricans]|uniref:Uncharacterized protein n=1 Tax=Enterovibrio nigricans DSM 22720 TaxID=1121868 RepID=A0A1T4WBC4_9GAMM|nr:hypothetical protein [Enterovibrio nigricans]PKF48765.1 hypothetical protein AT251_23775 [Enterovibrio nigricans]SKA74348.1 hypothetical protein SAMN02745132_04852 [Enterovibrio nigricans DSM 22720]